MGGEHSARLVQVPERVDRPLDLDTGRHVEHVPAGQEGRVQAPELLFHRGHAALEQVLLQDLGAVLRHVEQRRVDHALGLERLVQVEVLDAPVVAREDSRPLAITGQGPANRRRQLGDRLHPVSFARDRCERLWIQLGKVRVSPFLALAGGHGRLDERLPSLTPELGEQRWLVNAPDVARQSARDGYVGLLTDCLALRARHHAFSQRWFSSFPIRPGGTAVLSFLGLGPGVSRRCLPSRARSAGSARWRTREEAPWRSAR